MEFGTFILAASQVSSYSVLLKCANQWRQEGRNFNG